MTFERDPRDRRRVDGQAQRNRDAEVARMRRAGVPFRTIAERLDMSLGAVQKSVRRSQKLADAMATGQPGDVLAAGDDLGVRLEAASRGGALARHRSVSATSSSGPPGSASGWRAVQSELVDGIS
jgi:hypothetical protein